MNVNVFMYLVKSIIKSQGKSNSISVSRSKNSVSAYSNIGRKKIFDIPESVIKQAKGSFELEGLFNAVTDAIKQQP